MIQGLTLGQVAKALAFLVALIGSIKYLRKEIDALLDKKLAPISKKVDESEISRLKDYLVKYLSDLENGESVSEIETERAYEAYDLYTNKYKQNSYIHKWWERMVSK